MKHFQVGSGKTICQPPSQHTLRDPFTGAHMLSFAAPQLRTPPPERGGAFSAHLWNSKSLSRRSYVPSNRAQCVYALIDNLSRRRRACVEKPITPRHAAFSVSKLSVWWLPPRAALTMGLKSEKLVGVRVIPRAAATVANANARSGSAAWFVQCAI